MPSVFFNEQLLLLLMEYLNFGCSFQTRVSGRLIYDKKKNKKVNKKTMAEAIDIRELNERIERESAFVTNLVTGMDQVIVGQKHLVESLLIGLLSDGHILLEGVPGLAKTLAIKTLASLIDSKYSRVQFTPDLLPADIVGTMIYSQKDEQFVVNKDRSLPTSCWPMKSTVLRQSAECLARSDAGTPGNSWKRNV